MSAADHYSASQETARMVELFQREQVLLADLRASNERRVKFEKSLSLGNGILIGAVAMAAVAIVATFYPGVCK